MLCVAVFRNAYAVRIRMDIPHLNGTAFLSLSLGLLEAKLSPWLLRIDLSNCHLQGKLSLVDDNCLSLDCAYANSIRRRQYLQLSDCKLAQFPSNDRVQGLPVHLLRILSQTRTPF
jgi:hypothetical protein